VRVATWHKTKEEAQDAAALDHDNLKNEHEGRGIGEIPTGRRVKYFNEYNFPDVVNNGRAPDSRQAQPYQVNWVVHGQGRIGHSVPILRSKMRGVLQSHGIEVTDDNLPSAAWMNNHIDMNLCCEYCSGEREFSDGSYGYQIDAIILHARGGPGYTEANMAPVSCFAFTHSLILLTHSLLSFQCCTFCNRAKSDESLETFLAYTRRFRDDQHETRRIRRQQARNNVARPYALAAERSVLHFFTPDSIRRQRHGG
jgi:hypothetical protein